MLSLFLIVSMNLLPDDPPAFPESTKLTGPLPKAAYFKKAMVAAANPLASEAGVKVMRNGGNAIDAMVATQMVLGLVEPQSSGIGGGAFIVYYDAKSKELVCIDGREECPAGTTRKDFLDAGGKLVPFGERITGSRSAGVPGTVAAMHLAHSKFGKLSWKAVIAPAVELAQNGFTVTDRFQEAIEDNQKRLQRFPTSKSYFFTAEGKLLPVGTLLKNPGYAKTLTTIAEQGPAGFYQGTVADAIVKACENDPVSKGKITKEDLMNYRAVVRKPIHFSHNGHEVYGMPAPSSGTYTLGLICGLLQTIPKEKRKPGTIEEMDSWCKAEAVAFADRNAYLGDQDWSPLRMIDLLDLKRIALRRTSFKEMKSGSVANPGPVPGTGPSPIPSTNEDGTDTTHFSIVDSEGNVVSCTSTIETGMGCAHMVEGCGFLLNNELTDFSLQLTEAPNALDPTRQPRRTALDAPTSIGGKRPRSSMTPIIVFKNNKPYLSLGAPGGAQIIGIVGQSMLGVLDFDMDVQSAINLPRISCMNQNLLLEELYPQRSELVKQLSAKGWKVQPLTKANATWGGAHGIRLLPDGRLEGGFDPRREGAVRGID